MLKMCGKKRKEIKQTLKKINTPIAIQLFYKSWYLFQINSTQFLNYILTRIQVMFLCFFYFFFFKIYKQNKNILFRLKLKEENQNHVIHH